MTLRVEDLLLDPNNPRFSKSHKDETREELYADPEVQEDTLKNMLENEDVHEVEASIRRAGFLDLDPIFVRQIKQTKKYVVLEGNRRISAAINLLKKHNEGVSKSDKLPKEIYDSLQEIPCKDLSGFTQAEIDYLLGLRHGGAIKQWQPLPASFNLYKMYMREFCSQNSCENSLEQFKYDPKILKGIAASFSITPQAATKRLKTYRVYADLADKRPELKGQLEKKYSVIEEMISKKSVREEFKFDDVDKFVFSEEGADLFFDVVFGTKDRPSLVGGASVGSREGASVRDFAAVLSRATGKLREEFVERRMYEKRESPEELHGELVVREKERTLKTALSAAAAELSKITQGELIFNSEIGEAEKEILDKIKAVIVDIDKKIAQSLKSK